MAKLGEAKPGHNLRLILEDRGQIHPVPVFHFVQFVCFSGSLTRIPWIVKEEKMGCFARSRGIWGEDLMTFFNIQLQ